MRKGGIDAMKSCRLTVAPRARFRTLLLTLCTLAISACGSVDVQDYASERPRFVPETFFDGSLVAHGIIKDRSGRVTRRFVAEIDASWENGVGTLDERFVFSDGERDTRVWTLNPAGEGRYVGTAGDVMGEAPITVAGNAMFLKYTLRAPFRDGTVDLSIDDRMYLIDENTLLNESIMRKFGFRVGEINLVIRRLPEETGGNGN
jgi:hypothetical protein